MAWASQKVDHRNLLGLNSNWSFISLALLKGMFSLHNQKDECLRKQAVKKRILQNTGILKDSISLVSPY